MKKHLALGGHVFDVRLCYCNRHARHRPASSAAASRRAAKPSRRRVRRDAAAGRADDADAARADRDDHDRSRADRAARRGCGRSRRAGAHGLFRQLHLRARIDGRGVAAGRAGVRRRRRQAHPPLAARRPVDRTPDLAADDGLAALWRAHPAGARTGAAIGRARAALSERAGLGHRAGARLHRVAQHDERGEPAAAAAVDHALQRSPPTRRWSIA